MSKKWSSPIDPLLEEEVRIDVATGRRVRQRRFRSGEMEQVFVDGMGPDAPLAVNSHGGRQSQLPYRLDLLPPRATLAVGKVLKHGADKYGENNWHAISTREHLSHLLAHVFAWLAGDASDEHLEHAACRALMALEIERRGGPEDHTPPSPEPAATAAHAACRVETPDFIEIPEIPQEAA